MLHLFFLFVFAIRYVFYMLPIVDKVNETSFFLLSFDAHALGIFIFFHAKSFKGLFHFIS